VLSFLFPFLPHPSLFVLRLVRAFEMFQEHFEPLEIRALIGKCSEAETVQTFGYSEETTYIPECLFQDSLLQLSWLFHRSRISVLISKRHH